MKIVTWNVNGLRSLIKDSVSIDSVFAKLDADIVCFQESRIGQSEMRPEYLPSEYDVFMTYCTKNNGYAGVCTYVRQSLLPEQCFSSIRSILSFITVDERDEIEKKYDSLFVLQCDEEGRVLMIQYSNIVIVNVYFPAGGEEMEKRKQFRRQFYELIQEIIVALKKKTEHIILLGDFNTACGLLDSAYMLNEAITAGFVDWTRSMSEWLDFLLLSSLEGGVGMIDIFRYLHPSERTQYTCFNTKLGGRMNNFGTRIDYLVCTDTLKGRLRTCHILSDIQGSDHLPVHAEIEIDIITHSKGVMGLRSELGNQQKIQQFFSVSQCERVVKSEEKIEKESSNDDYWVCGRCTYENKVVWRSCEVCGAMNWKRGKEEKSIDSLFCNKRVKKKPTTIPLCNGHQVLCVRHQVNKEGKNKGRYFFSCSLHIGFSGDPKARCGYFKWEDED